MLHPSPLGGVGVFATHDIPIGTHLFNIKLSPQVKKIKNIPPLLLQYCIYISDEECLSPKRFDHMQIGWYINHSSTPNILAKKTAAPSLDAISTIDNRILFALRDIKAGDEILIDYNSLDEPEHLRADYYKK
jgi:SET domain-containing protein